MPTSNGHHHGHGHNGGPLPPDGMYHVSDSISGIGADGIGEKVNGSGRSCDGDSNDENSGGAAASGVGLYRRLPSSTCV